MKNPKESAFTLKRKGRSRLGSTYTVAPPLDFTSESQIAFVSVVPSGQWPLDRCPSVIRRPADAGVFFDEQTVRAFAKLWNVRIATAKSARTQSTASAAVGLFLPASIFWRNAD
jgi:hypothetical protein